jgi:hypothetical protein
MKDANFNLTKALPNAAANNNTAGLDLNIIPGVNTTGKTHSNKWRLAYFEVDVPALSDHTNTSVNNTISLQDSADNSNFANTQPLVQIVVPGVASTGSAALTARVPLPPLTRRYIRFNQNVPANGGIGNNATVNYDLVT